MFVHFELLALQAALNEDLQPDDNTIAQRMNEESEQRT